MPTSWPLDNRARTVLAISTKLRWLKFNQGASASKVCHESFCASVIHFGGLPSGEAVGSFRFRWRSGWTRSRPSIIAFAFGRRGLGKVASTFETEMRVKIGAAAR